MEVGSPEWIEASLAKLDDLERQRGEHEAALESAHDPLTLKQHNDALERLDAQIKSLYAQLEELADEDEDEDDAPSSNDEVAPRATQGDDELSSPHIMAGSTPFAVAAASSIDPIRSPPIAETPFGSPSSSGFDAPPPAPPVITDDDLKPPGGGGKWAFFGLVIVAGLGVGGYFAWQNMQAQKAKEQAKPTAAEEIKIEAAAIPDDTEAPNAAKGGDATISPTAGTPGTPAPTKKVEEKKKKPLKIKGGGDPLGGSGDPLG